MKKDIIVSVCRYALYKCYREHTGMNHMYQYHFLWIYFQIITVHNTVVHILNAVDCKDFQSFTGPFISAINIWMAIGPAKDILQSMVAHDLVYPMATSKVYILK